MKFAFSVLLACLFALSSLAQASKFELGIAIAPTHFGQNPDTYATGFNIFGGILADDEFGLLIGLAAFNTPNKTIQSESFSSNENFSVAIINLEGQFNFGKANNYSSGIYIPIGFSYLIGKYNYQERSATRQLNLNEDLSGLNIDLGLGYYYKLNKITLFTDLRIGIPISIQNQNQFVNNLNAYNPTPFQTIFKAGVKFPIKLSGGANPFIDKR